MAQKAKKGAAKKSGGVKAAAKKAVARAAQKVKGVAKKVGAKKKESPAKAPAKKGAASPKRVGAGAKKTVSAPVTTKRTAKKATGYAAGDASTLPGPHDTHAGTPAAMARSGKPPRRVSARLSGATVDDYIASAPVPHKAVLAELRQVVMTACPETEVSIKWGQPVFECNGPFAWMKAFPRYVSLGFWRGAELPDPDGVLKGSGSRMRHVKITEPQHVPVAKIDALVRAAVKLNREKGDPSKGMKP